MAGLTPQFTTVAVGAMVTGPQLPGMDAIVMLGFLFTSMVSEKLKVPHLLVSVSLIMYSPWLLNRKEGTEDEEVVLLMNLKFTAESAAQVELNFVIVH